MIERTRLSRLVIATHNKGKLREFRDLLAPYVESVTSAGELGLPEPDETGATFAENAILKAHAAASLSGSLTLADDSGFCVTALDGRPGLYSARCAETNPSPPEGEDAKTLACASKPLVFAGEGVSSANTPSPANTKDLADAKSNCSLPPPPGGRNFQMAMKRVQDELGASPDRSAYFICVLALAWPDGRTKTVEGRIDGEFVWPPRGDKGHGYDPVFMPQGESRTFAEMDEDEKNAISHRGIAVRKLIAGFFAA